MAFKTFARQLNTRLQTFCDVYFDQFTNALVNYTKPVIKVDIVKWKGNGYISQRDLDKSYFLLITGFLGKDSIADGDTSNQWTLEDQEAILDFGEAVVSNVYQIHDEKQSETFVCPGFMQLGEFPEIWVNLEVAPKLMTFQFQLEVKFIQSDTEV